MLRVVTYNIRRGLGMDDRQDLTRVVDVLREIDADIACLQEVDYLNPRSSAERQAHRIAHDLNMTEIYHSNFRIGPVCGMGNAILCKGELDSTWNKKLPSDGEQRALLHASARPTRWQGRTIDVFCTHFGLSAPQRVQQSEQVLLASLQPAGPVIICGDLNAPPDSGDIALLVRSPAFRSVPSEGTFTAASPTVKIDYILHSRDLVLSTSHVIRTGASDHLPFVAELDLA